MFEQHGCHLAVILQLLFALCIYPEGHLRIGQKKYSLKFLFKEEHSFKVPSHLINQSIMQSINQSINQLIDRLRSIDQSINQSVSQSVSQIFESEDQKS